MPKEKVTLTLDAARIAELREVVGSRSLSAEMDQALEAHLARLRHLRAVDEMLAELEREHGEIPPQTLEWAAQVVEGWRAGKRGRRRGGNDAAPR